MSTQQAERAKDEHASHIFAEHTITTEEKRPTRRFFDLATQTTEATAEQVVKELGKIIEDQTLSAGTAAKASKAGEKARKIFELSKIQNYDWRQLVEEIIDGPLHSSIARPGLWAELVASVGIKEALEVLGVEAQRLQATALESIAAGLHQANAEAQLTRETLAQSAKLDREAKAQTARLERWAKIRSMDFAGQLAAWEPQDICANNTLNKNNWYFLIMAAKKERVIHTLMTWIETNFGGSFNYSQIPIFVKEIMTVYCQLTKTTIDVAAQPPSWWKLKSDILQIESET